jgi:predicted nuclease of predicted toxin-antitoxin system
MIVTVDTNVVINAWLGGEQPHIQVLSLIGVLPHLPYGFDHDGRINAEYRRKCSGNAFFEKWHKEIWEKVVFINGHIEQHHAAALADRGCHEPSDHIFAAVAYHADKYLVTEDSDFGKGHVERALAKIAVIAYLQEKLGLIVHDAREACTHLARVQR